MFIPKMIDLNYLVVGRRYTFYGNASGFNFILI